MVLRTGRRVVVRDLLAITAIAALLIAIHYRVPPRLQGQLAFHYADPDPITALTAAYLHHSAGHLWGNVIGYLAGAGFTYILCAGIDRRRWYWRTVLAFLTVLPVVVNAANLALVADMRAPPELTGRGFSGVVAGFGGFLVVATAVWLREAAGVSAAIVRRVGLGLVLVVLAGVGWLVSGPGSPVVWVTVGLLVVVAGGLGWRGARRGWPADRETQVWLGTVAVLVGCVVLIELWFVASLFTATPGGGRPVQNIFAHFVGFVIGGVLAVVVK